MEKNIATRKWTSFLAERKNRTLVEAARCMLLESGLPALFWGEAIMTANHVRNRCISKSIDGDIPYKRWTGKSPDVSHLQIFGCKAYVLDKSTNRGKFDSKTVEGIFVGYSDYPKGYRVWIPSEQKIRISSDVKFFEEFESNEYEDIISSETLNGRFKLSDLLGNMDPSGRVDIDICGGGKQSRRDEDSNCQYARNSIDARRFRRRRNRR
jgi:hypothetical protein